jgi:hypothetical protein
MPNSQEEFVDALMARVRAEIDASTLKATLATWVSQEAVDANLSTIVIDSREYTFVPKATDETFVNGDPILVLYSGGIPQTILGKQRGNTHLA